MARSLRAFIAEGDERRVSTWPSWNSIPRPDEAVIRALNDGASRVVFATVFVTISSHTKAGQDMVKELVWTNTVCQSAFRAIVEFGNTDENVRRSCK